MANIIEFEQVSYTYQPNTPFAHTALQKMSFQITEQSYTTIIGHTGSGKSTLLQLFNGLLLPTTGQINIAGHTLTKQTKAKELQALRQKVGLVFQFSEAQLFAETVLDDVAFGPQNFGCTKQEAEERAKKALAQVGLSPEVYERSPFDLSGGQMRRVAIAGVLAMEPEILILDEPTIGLDPKGRKEIMQLFANLHKQGLTIILVTHAMDDVANFAEQVLVLEHGHLIQQTTPAILFADEQWLLKHHLALPQTMKFYTKLQAQGWAQATALPLTLDQLATYILKERRGSKND